MLAVKAEYDNGTVRWKKEPPVAGKHLLTVVFDDVEDVWSYDDPLHSSDARKEEAIRALRGFCKNVPGNVSMVDELIAERRREAQLDERS